MTGDQRKVVVTAGWCSICGTPRVKVHHQSFPEMQISGESLDQAVNELIDLLEANVVAVSDPLHRTPVVLAIADVQSFVNERSNAMARMIAARSPMLRSRAEVRGVERRHTERQVPVKESFPGSIGRTGR